MESLKNTKHLYSAYFRIPKDDKAVFKVSEIDIVKTYDACIEVDAPYFISRNNSTRFFDSSNLDKEFKITEEMTCFYSTDKNMAVTWLTDKKQAITKEAEERYNSLRCAEWEICR